MTRKLENLQGNESSFNAFEILVLSYPIYLVATADGKFDEAEKELLGVILTNFLDSVYGTNVSVYDKKNMVLNYLDDFEFLKLNENEFKVTLLELLNTFNDEVKSSIKNLIQEVAETSNAVAESEKIMIDYLSTCT